MFVLEITCPTRFFFLFNGERVFKIPGDASVAKAETLLYCHCVSRNFSNHI
jgi:hypothetical protein